MTDGRLDLTDEQHDLLVEFDEAVGPGGVAPDDDLLEELAGCYDVQVRHALLRMLAELTHQDLPAGRRRADHLGRLAAMLYSAEAAVLRTATHLLIGEAAAAAELWPEAAQRMGAALLHIDGGPFADEVPLCELVLGEAADHAGRRAEALTRWEAARTGFLEQQRWSQAAEATALLAWAAGDAGERSPEAVARWGEAADLAERSGQSDEARDFAERACSLALAAVSELGDENVAMVLRVAVEARSIAERHRVAVVAPLLAIYLGIYGAEAGWVWPRVRQWFDTARRELRGQDRPPDRLEGLLGGVDLAEGAAATSRGMLAEAETPLRSALAKARHLGLAEAERFSVRMLAGVHGVTEMTDIGRIARLVARQDWTDPESAAAALVVQAVDVQNTGSGDPQELLNQARVGFASAGPQAEYKLLMLDLLSVGSRLPSGDAQAVQATREALERAEAFLIDGAARLPGTAARAVRAVAGMVRMMLARHTAGPLAAAAAAAEVEAELHSFGAGPLAALMACSRGELLLEAGDARQALEVTLPAVLALDALRFTFRDADRRRRWSAVVAKSFAVAFRAGAACGETVVLAELIEVARGNGVPLPCSHVDPMTELFATMPPTEQPQALTDRTLTGASSVAGVEAGHTELGLPAKIRTPWSTIALAQALERARRYHDPVRADSVVEWRVVEMLTSH